MVSPKTALVTGATGIIGRHAVRRLLDKGINVIAVARGNFENVHLECEMRRIDLLDAEAAQTLVREIRPDALLHLAWITKHGEYWNSTENFDWIANSYFLVQAFIESGGRRLVAAGTCAEYDFNFPYINRIKESDMCKPGTLYGKAKLGLNQMLSDYAKENDVSYAWGRLFMVYGEDEADQRLAPSVIRSLLAHRPAECSSGRQVRDFLECRDAGAAFAELLMSKTEGTVNICSGEAITIADFAGRIANIIGRPDLLHLGALPDRADDPHYLVGDPARLMREVEFSPAFSLDRGLHDAVERLAIQG